MNPRFDDSLRKLIRYHRTPFLAMYRNRRIYQVYGVLGSGFEAKGLVWDRQDKNPQLVSLEEEAWNFVGGIQR